MEKTDENIGLFFVMSDSHIVDKLPANAKLKMYIYTIIGILYRFSMV